MLLVYCIHINIVYYLSAQYHEMCWYQDLIMFLWH
jgi:hypothetical protein